MMEEPQSYEQRIVELESNLERAALLGKQLLEQLSLKSSEFDELLERCTGYEVQLDTLKQKLHTTEREYDFAVAREKNALKEIDCLKGICTEFEELQQRHKTLEERSRYLESEKQRRSQTLADLEEHLLEVRTELSFAKTQLEEQKLLEQQRNCATNLSSEACADAVAHGDDDDDDGDGEKHQTKALVSKVESLQTELSNIRIILKQAVEEKEFAIKESLQNESKLEEALEEKCSIEQKLAGYVSALAEKKRQISELNEEIEGLKFSETNPYRRGNSLFAEVEDRRLEVEAKLVEAHARLRFADESQRRLKTQLAHCYTSLQVMAAHSSKADRNYVHTLEREVMRLRAELSAAATRVATTKADDEIYTENDLRDNPLTGMLLSERRQNAVFKKKIEELIRQEERRTQEMLRLGAELRSSQSEIEQFEKQRTILLMKLKEKQIIERSSESGSSPSSQPEVIKEVLVDIVQQTERDKQTERKLLAADKDTEALPATGASAVSETSSVAQTFRDQVESKENLSPTLSEQANLAIKAVNFAADTGVEEKPKQLPRAKGHRVTVVKSTKAGANDCKTQ